MRNYKITYGGNKIIVVAAATAEIARGKVKTLFPGEKIIATQILKKK